MWPEIELYICVSPFVGSARPKLHFVEPSRSELAFCEKNAAVAHVLSFHVWLSQLSRRCFHAIITAKHGLQPYDNALSEVEAGPPHLL